MKRTTVHQVTGKTVFGLLFSVKINKKFHKLSRFFGGTQKKGKRAVIENRTLVKSMSNTPFTR